MDDACSIWYTCVSASASNWGYVIFISFWSCVALHMGWKNYDCISHSVVVVVAIDSVTLPFLLQCGKFRLNQGWPSLSHSIIASRIVLFILVRKTSCWLCLSINSMPHKSFERSHSYCTFSIRSNGILMAVICCNAQIWNLVAPNVNPWARFQFFDKQKRVCA